MNDQMKPIKTSLDHPLKFPEGNHVQLSYCFVTNCSNHVSYCFVTFLSSPKVNRGQDQFHPCPFLTAGKQFSLGARERAPSSIDRAIVWRVASCRQNARHLCGVAVETNFYLTQLTLL